MIGKVLNSRYRLTDLLGEGGMALVYKARDLLLDRWVALKILRPQYVSDKDFVNRFHREAKAVASLSHPNIVNIYDIGQDKDIHYLVMENVEGESLNELIKREGTLLPLQALEIAMQICEALAVAHRNNIVHCDIKPHNILITHDGGVKVTDFGIARAVNSATMVQTETVIGTAHYFSPEQARGETINARSDLYSLGVVLYEMLTGQVPFRGDSPIAVALKHINEEPLPPSQLNEKLPKRIDKLVMKVLMKDPNKRYENANDMLKALHGMARTFDRKEAVTEEGSQLAKAYSEDDQTQVLPRIRESRKAKEGQVTKDAKDKKEDITILDKLIKPLAIILISFLVLGIISIWALENYTKVPEVKVPNFVGISKEDAEKRARTEGVRVMFNDIKVASPDIPEDFVATQDIEAGKNVKKNRVIILTLSKGMAKTAVPNLAGMEMREVNVALHDADLVVGDVGYEYTLVVPKGQVISQTPAADSEVKSGSKVNITLSKGPEPTGSSAPNFVGLTRAEAEQAILEANFLLGTVSEEETSRFPEGFVAKQDPAAGTTTPEGTPINLVVSKGIRNPKNLPVYSFQAVVNVLDGVYEQKIQVIIQDDNGREEIYNKVHHPGDRVVVKNIYAVGPAILQVYNNGELVEESKHGF